MRNYRSRIPGNPNRFGCCRLDRLGRSEVAGRWMKSGRFDCLDCACRLDLLGLNENVLFVLRASFLGEW